MENFKIMFHHSSSHFLKKSLYSTLKNRKFFEGKDEKKFTGVSPHMYTTNIWSFLQ